MGLYVGSTPVTGVYVGSTPVTGIYAGTSVGYDLIWQPGDMVRITGTVDNESRDQFRQALTDRGLDYTTITEVPFRMNTSKATNLRFLFDGCVNLVTAPELDTSNATTTRNMFQNCSSLTLVPWMDTSKSTDMAYMFFGCSSLTTVPDMDTAQVTNMNRMFGDCAALTSVPDLNASNVTDMGYMFYGCSSLTVAPAMDTSSVTTMRSMFYDCTALTYVPDLQTSNVAEVSYMFRGCSSLTDGNVRLIGKRTGVVTDYMIFNSGLTREPFYTTDGQPWPTEVHEVSLTDVYGNDTVHPLLTVTVPAGETWSVRIQGTMTKTSSAEFRQPEVRIGDATFGPYGQGEEVDCSGTVTSADTTIAIVTKAGASFNSVSFVGTVTIEK